MMTGFKKNKARKGDREIWANMIFRKILKKAILEGNEKISHSISWRRTFKAEAKTRAKDLR